jgi:hypothetical protein
MAIAFFIFCEFFLQLKRKVCCKKVEKARQARHLQENGVDLPVLLPPTFKQQTTKSKRCYGSGVRQLGFRNLKLRTILNRVSVYLRKRTSSLYS